MSKNQEIAELIPEDPLVRPIYECLTPKMKEAYLALSEKTKAIPLTELEKDIEPTVMLRQVKLRFWYEYNKTVAENRPVIEVSKICNEICSREFLYGSVLKKDKVLAWLFHPPTGYDTAAEEALEFGIKKVREMLEAPIFAEPEPGVRGVFLKENASVVLQAVRFLDARVKGSPLQRIENKNMNLHVHNHGGVSSQDDLQREIEEIRAKLANQVTPLALSAPEDPE